MGFDTWLCLDNVYNLYQYIRISKFLWLVGVNAILKNWLNKITISIAWWCILCRTPHQLSNPLSLVFNLRHRYTRMPINQTSRKPSSTCWETIRMWSGFLGNVWESWPCTLYSWNQWHLRDGLNNEVSEIWRPEHAGVPIQIIKRLSLPSLTLIT